MAIDKTKPKRKFLDLGVDEISLVDEPANESPILVMKRKEQAQMSTQATAEITATEDATDDTAVTKSESETSAEVIEIDAGEETPADIVKQLQGIAEKLVAKAKGDDESEESTEKAGEKKMPPFMAKAQEEKAKKAAALRKTLKGAGLDDAKINAAVKAAFGDSGLGLDKAPVKKTAGDVDEETAMRAMELMATAISKAKKFTPKRVQELQDVVTKLNLLLGEVTEETPAKAAFGPSGISTEGTGAPPMAAPVQDTAATGGPGNPRNAITKGVDADALTEAVSKALAPLAEALTGLNGRVESIEKSRTPKTAVEEGETETTTETTKSKSLWSGVL
jgi:hypothetical protein